MNHDYERVLATALDNLDTTHQSNAGDAARWVRQQVAKAVAEKHAWAVEAQRSAEEEGHRRALNHRHQSRETVLVSYHGVPQQRPKRRGVAARNPDTGERAYQQKLWVSMTLADLRQRRADLIAQAAALGVEIEVNDRLLTFMEKDKRATAYLADHPDALVGEVLKAARTTLEAVLDEEQSA